VGGEGEVEPKFLPGDSVSFELFVWLWCLVGIAVLLLSGLLCSRLGFVYRVLAVATTAPSYSVLFL